MEQNLNESVTKARGLGFACCRNRKLFQSLLVWLCLPLFLVQTARLPVGIVVHIFLRIRKFREECSGFWITLVIMNKKLCSCEGKKSGVFPHEYDCLGVFFLSPDQEKISIICSSCVQHSSVWHSKRAIYMLLFLLSAAPNQVILMRASAFSFILFRQVMG